MGSMQIFDRGRIWTESGGPSGESRQALVFENNVQSMNDTRDPTQDGQTDVDEQISSTSSLEEDTEGREDDRKKDLADVRSSERHCG